MIINTTCNKKEMYDTDVWYKTLIVSKLYSLAMYFWALFVCCWLRCGDGSPLEPHECWQALYHWAIPQPFLVILRNICKFKIKEGGAGSVERFKCWCFCKLGSVSHQSRPGSASTCGHPRNSHDRTCSRTPCRINCSHFHRGKKCWGQRG
jgi:hypothetical protein